MLYNSLAKKPKNFPRALLSSFMIFRGITGHCPSYKIAKKELVAAKPSNITMKIDLTINKPVSFVYQIWKNIENFPLFMKHIESVTVLDDEISIWKAKIPGELGNLSWNAAIIKEVENKEISWRSFSDAAIHHIGKIDFRDNGNYGTNFKVTISYRIPFGSSGEKIGKVLNPIFENMVEQDLNRFKEYIENK